MKDLELESHLEKIEDELQRTRIAATGLRQTFWRGCVYGAGYVIGAILVIVMAGWILNVIGVIPAFSREVNDFRVALENISGSFK